MTKQYQWITFKEISLQRSKRKTKTWQCNVKTGGYLGIVQWYSHWRRYCFFPDAHLLFDANCLCDIADFIANATTEHKQKKTTV
jgi:hypothetical protein